ncbi:S41 family peptidase [Planctomycetota bacterium]
MNMNKLFASSLKTLMIIVLSIIISGCGTVPTPKLTAEDRKKDIEFLAKWARDYSPLVELAEKHKGNQSYEALLPKYLQYAEQAQSDEEFCHVVRGYYDLICSSGHRHLIRESLLKGARIGILLGIIDVGISPFTVNQARYWPRLSSQHPICAHPPFDIVRKEDKFFTDSNWQDDGIIIPRGSHITKVNGMSCSSYLDFLKKNTFLRYWAFTDKTIAREQLLIINEGHDFAGWQIDFLLPDGSVQQTFVPKLKACPGPKIRTVEQKENCTCIELTDEVAYIRIKSMMPSGLLGFIFPSINRKDGKIIKSFLENANSKYRKLIIDIRGNSGGMPYYVYENLIRPFLDEPVRYDQVAGIRRKYRDNLKPSVLKTLRKWCSRKKEHVVNIEEVDAPSGFDSKEWVFYRLTRSIEPRNRYNFDGSLYILVDDHTFSAADDYANAVKRIGLAKLVGRNTSGSCAAYIGPPVIRLPASGMIFRVETEIVINPDGSINELFGTPPDVELPPADPPKSITREELLKDEWIKYIIHEM